MTTPCQIILFGRHHRNGAMLTKVKVAFQLVADVVNHFWHFGRQGKSETNEFIQRR